MATPKPETLKAIDWKKIEESLAQHPLDLNPESSLLRQVLRPRPKSDLADSFDLTYAGYKWPGRKFDRGEYSGTVTGRITSEKSNIDEKEKDPLRFLSEVKIRKHYRAPEFIESSLMVINQIAWHKVRSPSRAKRRLAQGKRSHLPTEYIPDPALMCMEQNGHTYILGHPETLKELRRKLSEQMRDFMHDYTFLGFGATHVEKDSEV